MSARGRRGVGDAPGRAVGKKGRTGAADTTTDRWEHYIEAIDEVSIKKGYAKVRDVSHSLGVRLPTVSEMFSKLSEAGLVNYEKYSGVTLTAKGQEIADGLREKHRILRSLLEILGVPEDVADRDACAMEHILSAGSIERLTQFVEFVGRHDAGPIWLEHFREFYATGRVLLCDPDHTGECPVGGVRRRRAARAAREWG